MEKIENSEIDIDKIKSTNAITLISLIITIILLIILTGIVIILSLGENGLISKAKYAKEKQNQINAREKLEITLLEANTEKEVNSEYNNNSFLDNILKQNGISVNGNVVGVDNYKFILDRDKLIILDVIDKDVKTDYEIKSINKSDISVLIVIQSEENIIEQVECPNGNIIYSDNKCNVNIEYNIIPDCDYEFIITTVTGKKLKKIIRKDYTDGLLQQIESLNDKGKLTLEVGGTTTNNIYETVKYSINAINHNGDMVLDGTNTFEGATLKNGIYSFGNVNDIGNSTVLLKVNGNLIINSNITLTSVSGSNNGPKGFIVYCTGTLTNNGTITMNNNSAYVTGQNIYLYKNTNKEYNMVNALGGNAGARAVGNTSGTRNGGEGGTGASYNSSGGGRRSCKFL